jgi:threonine synthase
MNENKNMSSSLCCKACNTELPEDWYDNLCPDCFDCVEKYIKEEIIEEFCEEI